MYANGQLVRFDSRARPKLAFFCFRDLGLPDPGVTLLRPCAEEREKDFRLAVQVSWIMGEESLRGRRRDFCTGPESF